MTETRKGMGAMGVGEMPENGDDLSPDTVTGDPPVQTTTVPGVTMLRPDQVKEMEEFNRELAQRKAEMREITEQPPAMMMHRPFKDRAQPENPEQIVDAVQRLKHMDSASDRDFCRDLLRLWCAAPRSG